MPGDGRPEPRCCRTSRRKRNFPLALFAATRYGPGMGIGDMIASMLPSSIAFDIGGIAALLQFPLRGIPIGPATLPLMSPGGA